MFCSECGIQLDDNAEKCPRCGGAPCENIVDTAMADIQPRRKGRYITNVIFCGSIFCFVFFLLLYLISRYTPNLIVFIVLSAVALIVSGLLLVRGFIKLVITVRHNRRAEALLKAKAKEPGQDKKEFADELEKCYSLYRKGIISEEEYKTIKNRIIEKI